MDNVLRSDGHAVLRGRMEVPPLQHLQHLLLNAVTDSLQKLGFNHVSLRVDGNLDDHVPLHTRGQVCPRDWRVRKDVRESRNHFIAGERRAWNVSERRPTTSSLESGIVRRRRRRFFLLRLKLQRLWL